MVDACDGGQRQLRDLAEFLLTSIETQTLQFHAILKQWRGTSLRTLVGEFLPPAHETLAIGIIPFRRILRTHQHTADTAATLPHLSAIRPCLNLLVDDVLQGTHRSHALRRVIGVPSVEHEHVIGRNVII